MKTIKEIMGLVEKYGWAVVALNDAKSNSDIAQELAKVNESSAAIESALRELVERKPLSASEVGALLEDSGYLPADLESQAHFINGVRYAERAHGIGA